jgi:hypothetical protein
VVTAVFTFLILLAASQPAADEGRYKERYLVAIVPLLAIAFLVYLRNRLPHRVVVLTVAAGLILMAAREPLSRFTYRAPFYDSQTLDAAWLLQRHLGASESSLLIALLITLGAGFAVVATLRPRIAGAALPVAAALMLGVTAVAIHVDAVNNIARVNPTWVDDATAGAHVTAVATPSSPQLKLIKQLYWNPTITREVTLENAVPSDRYPTDQLKPGPNGELEGVRGYFLFDTAGTQATFTGATTVATNGSYVLYRGAHPRFRLLVENQLATAWLSPYTRLRAWPNARSETAPVVRFTLSLPPVGNRRVHVQLGTHQIVVVNPTTPLSVTCRSAHWPFKLLITSNDAVPDSVGRPVTVGMTNVTVGSGPSRNGPTSCSTSPA